MNCYSIADIVIRTCYIILTVEPYVRDLISSAALTLELAVFGPGTLPRGTAWSA